MLQMFRRRIERELAEKSQLKNTTSLSMHDYPPWKDALHNDSGIHWLAESFPDPQELIPFDSVPQL